MGWNDLVRDIKRPIYDIRNQLRREIRSQKIAIENVVEDGIEPLNERMDDLEDIFRRIQSESKRHFDDVIEPVMDSLDATQGVLEDMQDELQNMPDRFSSGFRTMQRAIQNVLDAVSSLSPGAIWEEVKGTLSIVIPLLISLWVLLQFGPQILISLIF